MARQRRTSDESEERQKLAQTVKEFMKNNLFTEKKLADVVGISRRTVQMLKAGAVTPHPATLEKLESLFMRYKREGK